MRLAAVAGLVVIVGAAGSMGVAAQGRQGGSGGPAARAAGGGPELRQVLYDAADVIGMLRTPEEVDRIASMNYWATGTIQMGGQACKLVDYKASVNWLLNGLRIDYRCEGSPQRHVEVVRDGVAWNETEPGKGASPAPAGAAETRALWLWTLPAGAIKAANRAGASARVGVANGKTTLTFPLSMPAATMTVTLGKDSFIEQIDTRVGAVTLTTTYGEFGDWNGSDYLSDVMFPKRIVQKRGTETLMDLTVTKTNTYNPYVIMPVPASLKSAAATPTAPPRR